MHHSKPNFSFQIVFFPENILCYLITRNTVAEN